MQISKFKNKITKHHKSKFIKIVLCLSSVFFFFQYLYISMSEEVFRLNDHKI